MEIFSVCIFCTMLALASSAGLKEEFTWTRLNYVLPQNSQINRRQVETESRYQVWDQDPYLTDDNENDDVDIDGASAGGDFFTSGSTGAIDYQYENNVPMGANVWKNKLFITVPRRRLGVPSTLNYVPLDSPQKHNVPLIPYPNLEMNLYPNPSRLNSVSFVSVYRVTVDACDRLWFVDTGILELPGNRTQIKPTTLTVIDLQTDRVIAGYVIPRDQLTDASLIAAVTVDIIGQSCDNTFVYLPDLGGYGLIVYSLVENRSWRITHNYFFHEPWAGDLTIGGYSFQWNDGVFSTELTEVKPDGFRDMYFHSMVGTHMYKVSTRVLRNETLATRPFHGGDFQDLGDRGPRSQTSMADLHIPTGIMFLALIDQNGLGCWNIGHSFKRISVVQKDDRRMIYPSDVKVYNDKVYVLTNNMPQFFYGSLNYDQVNFRVWSNTVQGAVQGTRCARKGLSWFSK